MVRGSKGFSYVMQSDRADHGAEPGLFSSVSTVSSVVPVFLLPTGIAPERYIIVLYFL